MTWALVIPLVMGVIMIVAAILLAVEKSDPVVTERWLLPPVIRIADGTDPALIELIAEARAMWILNGAPMSTTMKWEGPPVPEAGEIVFSPADPEDGTAGQAITTIGESGWVTKCEIRIKVKTLEIVTHEMGHALRVSHVWQRWHVMHPMRSAVGLQFGGVREAFEEAQKRFA